MKRVFYQGRPYEYIMDITEDGKRLYSLYKRRALAYVVAEDQLDNRRPLTAMLDNFSNEMKLVIPA